MIADNENHVGELAVAIVAACAAKGWKAEFVTFEVSAEGHGFLMALRVGEEPAIMVLDRDIEWRPAEPTVACCLECLETALEHVKEHKRLTRIARRTRHRGPRLGC